MTEPDEPTIEAVWDTVKAPVWARVETIRNDAEPEGQAVNVDAELEGQAVNVDAEPTIEDVRAVVDRALTMSQLGEMIARLFGMPDGQLLPRRREQR